MLVNNGAGGYAALLDSIISLLHPSFLHLIYVSNSVFEKGPIYMGLAWLGPGTYKEVCQFFLP